MAGKNTAVFGIYRNREQVESAVDTLIAAGFREVAGRKSQAKPSYLPKTWKAGRDQGENIVAPSQPEPQPNVIEQVARNVTEAIHEIPVDDLDVPTFLRRQAQKA